MTDQPVSQPNPAAIIFDLDGTLIDSALDFYAVVQRARIAANLPELETDRIRQQVSNGSPALVSLAWEITPDHPDFDLKRQAFLDDYAANIGSESRLFPGYCAVLSELELVGIQWGIVTNKHRRFAEIQLERLGIKTKSLVCGDDVSMPKPAPEALVRAAGELGVSPWDCWYVGDHIRDIQAAEAAGMKSIAARYGYIHENDNIDDWNADAQIDRADQLLDLIRQGQLGT